MPTELPVIDLDVFLTGPHNSEAVIQECKKVCFFKMTIITMAKANEQNHFLGC
jgi:hypothetical protein